MAIEDLKVSEEETLDLLTEWYEQWWDRDDMPNKIGKALHVRTAIVLLAHGRLVQRPGGGYGIVEQPLRFKDDT